MHGVADAPLHGGAGHIFAGHGRHVHLHVGARAQVEVFVGAVGHIRLHIALEAPFAAQHLGEQRVVAARRHGADAVHRAHDGVRAADDFGSDGALVVGDVADGAASLFEDRFKHFEVQFAQRLFVYPDGDIVAIVFDVVEGEMLEDDVQAAVGSAADLGGRRLPREHGIFRIIFAVPAVEGRAVQVDARTRPAADVVAIALAVEEGLLRHGIADFVGEVCIPGGSDDHIRAIRAHIGQIGCAEQRPEQEVCEQADAGRAFGTVGNGQADGRERVDGVGAAVEESGQLIDGIVIDLVEQQLPFGGVIVEAAQVGEGEAVICVGRRGFFTVDDAALHIAVDRVSLDVIGVDVVMFQHIDDVFGRGHIRRGGRRGEGALPVAAGKDGPAVAAHVIGDFFKAVGRRHKFRACILLRFGGDAEGVAFIV